MTTLREIHNQWIVKKLKIENQIVCEERTFTDLPIEDGLSQPRPTIQQLASKQNNEFNIIPTCYPKEQEEEDQTKQMRQEEQFD